MTDLLQSLADSVARMSVWELLAVLLAIAYLLLAIRQNIACWAAAIASAAIYTVLMFQAQLYMESVLQTFYIAMALYGWKSWRGAEQTVLRVSSWPLAFHFLPLLLIAALCVLSGTLLATYTNAALPYLDSFTTWGAIVTTWMVARKVLQNWHYWFVIDSVSIYLYLSRDLLLTAVLFGFYLLLIIIGYQRWRNSMQAVQ